MKLCLLMLSFFAFGACSTSTHSDPATGKHTITCMGAVSDCHDKARSICPDGYLVTNRVRPKRMEGDTQYTLNMKCRQAIFY